MGGRYCAINSPLGPRWGQRSRDRRSPWTSWWVNCAIPPAHVVSLYCLVVCIINAIFSWVPVLLKTWCHKKVSALLVLCKGNHRSPMGKGTIMRNFDVSYVVSTNNMLNKQSICRWFDTPWRSCNVTVMGNHTVTLTNQHEHDTFRIISLMHNDFLFFAIDFPKETCSVKFNFCQNPLFS